jgi:hypothetical protein
VAANEVPRAPYFLLFEKEQPLVVAVDQRPALPLFGSAEEAGAFLSSAGFGGELAAREVSREELIQVLEAHREQVEYVALNPPPASEGGMKVEMGTLPGLVDALRGSQREEDPLGWLGPGGFSDN